MTTDPPDRLLKTMARPPKGDRSEVPAPPDKNVMDPGRKRTRGQAGRHLGGHLVKFARLQVEQPDAGSRFQAEPVFDRGLETPLNEQPLL